MPYRYSKKAGIYKVKKGAPKSGNRKTYRTKTAAKRAHR